jgi:hypothetical protein
MPPMFRFPSPSPHKFRGLAFRLRGDISCPNPVLAARPPRSCGYAPVLGHRTQRHGLCRWRPAATLPLWTGSYCFGYALLAVFARRTTAVVSRGRADLRGSTERRLPFPVCYALFRVKASFFPRFHCLHCITLLRLTAHPAAFALVLTFSLVRTSPEGALVRGSRRPADFHRIWCAHLQIRGLFAASQKLLRLSFSAFLIWTMCTDHCSP